MDRERASAHTSERLADLRREGSAKAAEFERLASALDEEADEVEAQYGRAARAAATLRGAQEEVADLLSLLGGVLEDLVDLEESADEAEAKAAGRGGGGAAGGETLTPTLDAGRAAEDDASARAFEAARAAAIASAASLLRAAGAAEGRSYATADRVDELARTATDVAAELVTRMECALDEEEGTRKLLERARAARGANGTLVSFGSGTSGTSGTSETSSPGLDKASASFITGSTVDSPALLRVGGGYAGSPPKHGHALRAKMARNLEMHVRALTQRAKKAAREADLLERHLARVDRFQDESVGELELALWLLRGVDELTRREKAERLAAAKARSDKFKPSGQSVKYGKLKSIADKERTVKKKPAAIDDDAEEPSSPLHRHRERVQQRRRDDADLLRGFDLNGGMISAGSKPQTGSNDDTAVATVRKALAGAMESAAVLDDDGILDFTDDEDDARGVEVAPDETTSTPPPSRAFIAGVHRGSALPPTPGADVSAKILNDGKTPARRPKSVERSSDVRGAEGAEGAESAEETFHTPVTELVRASRPTPSPSPAVSPPEHKSTYILPFGKSTYKSFKRNVLGIPSKKDKGASKG